MSKIKPWRCESCGRLVSWDNNECSNPRCTVSDLIEEHGGAKRFSVDIAQSPDMWVQLHLSQHIIEVPYLSSLDRLQIEMGARGTLSGLLKEWPLLIAAFDKLKQPYHPDDSAICYREICQHWLRKMIG